MLITSHSWKLILKPSWTILVNSFNLSCTGEGGGQQCHRRAGAPPCLISTLPFFFGSKITEPRTLFIAFTGLQWPVPSLQLTICLLTMVNQPLVTAPWRRAEVTALEWGSRSEGGWWPPEWCPVEELKHASFWETEEGVRSVRVIKGEFRGDRGRRSQNSHK